MYGLFDIGGTKTRVAISRDLRSFEEPKIFDTPQAYSVGVSAVVAALKEMSGEEVLVSVAGGVRGPLLSDQSGIAHDSVLTDWQGKPLRQDIGEALNAPVFLENDAALAGLGEAHYGAGKGDGIVAYHTISTGMGGVRIVNGKIDAHHSGFEPGHQVVDADGTLCAACSGVTLEEQISGAALEARFHKKPYDISQEDPVWDELAQLLAYGLKNTVVYWAPESIVLGGSMIVGDPRIRLADIERHTKALLDGFVSCPPIRDALLGDVGGLYGAMVLLSAGEGK